MDPLEIELELMKIFERKRNRVGFPMEEVHTILKQIDPGFTMTVEAQMKPYMKKEEEKS